MAYNEELCITFRDNLKEDVTMLYNQQESLQLRVKDLENTSISLSKDIQRLCQQITTLVSLLQWTLIFVVTTGVAALSYLIKLVVFD